MLEELEGVFSKKNTALQQDLEYIKENLAQSEQINDQ